MGCSSSRQLKLNSNVLSIKDFKGSDDNLLENASLNTPLFTLNGLKFTAKCVKCYDADTIHIVIFYNGIFQRFVTRLIGIDSAEIKTHNEKEKQHAIKARDYLKDLILDKLILIECNKFDKYGRLLITVYYNDLNINDELVTLKYAYKYDGKTKQSFDEWSK
jgi:endonuclease YncB( thermonuclease family)